MTIYGVDIGGGPLEILKWPDRKTAQRAGNSWMLVENAKELFESSVSNGRLAELWNFHNPDTPIQKFADREKGAEEVFAFFERVAISPKKLSTAPEGEAKVARGATAKKSAAATPGKKAAAQAVATKKGKGNAANLKTRTSKYSGMKLTPSKEAAAKNPRKEGSHGFKSIEIIRKNPGITYEDYIKKGGRNNDLEWDVSKGNVTTK